MTELRALDNSQTAYRIRAEDFWRLAGAGAFDAYAKSELIEGEIWVVNAIHAWHGRTVGRMALELGIALREIASPLVVYSPVSVALADDSVPEPDLAVGDDDDDEALPLAKLRIAIEVSDTSFKNDLHRKGPLYARAGVPEYWVVDRDGRQIIQMWSPTAEGYAKRDEIAFGERIKSATIDGLSVETDGL